MPVCFQLFPLPVVTQHLVSSNPLPTICSQINATRSQLSAPSDPDQINATRDQWPAFIDPLTTTRSLQRPPLSQNEPLDSSDPLPANRFQWPIRFQCDSHPETRPRWYTISDPHDFNDSLWPSDPLPATYSHGYAPTSSQLPIRSQRDSNPATRSLALTLNQTIRSKQPTRFQRPAPSYTPPSTCPRSYYQVPISLFEVGFIVPNWNNKHRHK